MNRRVAITTAVAVASLMVLLVAGLLDVWLDDDGQRVLGIFDLRDDKLREVFVEFRLPRVLAAVIVGAGLGAAGAAFQGLLRNPLAEPYTLGISSGAALAAVIAIRFGLDRSLGGGGIGVAALIGALATVTIIYRLAKTGDRLPTATLLLAGITIAMFCGAATLLIQYTAEISQVYRMVQWMMGGIEAVRYAPLLRTAIAVLIGVVALIALAPTLNALAAGEDAAASLGVNVKRSVSIGFFAASLIVGASIALAGPIGFIGLIVPHALRTLVGPDHRILVPLSALGGATLLCACDTAARLVSFPAEFPVGVITAVLGGPFFLYLLFRHRASGRLWGG